MSLRNGRVKDNHHAKFGSRLFGQRSLPIGLFLLSLQKYLILVREEIICKAVVRQRIDSKVGLVNVISNKSILN